ncbi:MAG TPA: helix-turn-helix domain-containing protein [Paenibacillus sp.]|nr:helix-turn-helix domain-containing protein [Paenibacillus sp.]
MNKHPERLMNEHYLTLSSPFRIFRHELTVPIAVHWHEFYELALVVAGEGTHVLNGEPARIARGTMFLLSPADFHELIPQGNEPLRLFNIIFTRQFLRDELFALLFDDPRAYALDVEEESMPMLIDACERLWTESNSPGLGGDFLVQGALELLLVELARRQRRSAEPNRAEARPLPGHPSVRRAILYIERHFRDAISLADVAAYAGLSASHFSESFRAHVGTTFQSFLQGLRLRFAASLLSATTLPITEICYASGFNTVTHFEKAFKARFGAPPREYRRQSVSRP